MKRAMVMVTVATLLLSGASTLKAGVITFDEAQFNGAPPYFSGVTPGGPYGPTISVNGVTFTGGVVLNQSDYANEANTAPNLYATSNFFTLADGSSLPGSIRGTFSTPVRSVSLYIANGDQSSSFTLSAYSAANTLLASDTISLSSFGSGSSAVGFASVSADSIDYFVVTSGQGSDNIDFAIDTRPGRNLFACRRLLPRRLAADSSRRNCSPDCLRARSQRRAANFSGSSRNSCTCLCLTEYKKRNTTVLGIPLDLRSGSTPNAGLAHVHSDASDALLERTPLVVEEP